MILRDEHCTLELTPAPVEPVVDSDADDVRLDADVSTGGFVGPGIKKLQRKSRGCGVRDENGVVVEELEQRAVRQTQAIYDALMAGRSPFAQPAIPNDSAPLTLTAGFGVATTVPTGSYVVESDHLSEMRRSVRDILEIIGRTSFGESRTWDSLNNAVVRELWLGLGAPLQSH